MKYPIPSFVSTLVLDLTFYLSFSSKEETIEQLLDRGHMIYKQAQDLFFEKPPLDKGRKEISLLQFRKIHRGKFKDPAIKQQHLLVYYYFKTEVKEIYATS